MTNKLNYHSNPLMGEGTKLAAGHSFKDKLAPSYPITFEATEDITGTAICGAGGIYDWTGTDAVAKATCDTEAGAKATCGNEYSCVGTGDVKICVGAEAEATEGIEVFVNVWTCLFTVILFGSSASLLLLQYP